MPDFASHNPISKGDILPGDIYPEAATSTRNLPYILWSPISEKEWRIPAKLNRIAEKTGDRDRLMLSIDDDAFAWRDNWTRLFALIAQTPHIDWLILTRPGHLITELLPEAWYQRKPSQRQSQRQSPKYRTENGDTYGAPEGTPMGYSFPANVWFGTDVEDQATAEERLPHLFSIPAAVLFLKCTLRGPIHFDPIALRFPHTVGPENIWPLSNNLIQWVTCGGHQGATATPMHPEWVRGLRNQCVSAGVPFCFEGWGEWKPISEMPESEYDVLYRAPSRRYPEAGRSCKVATTPIQFDGGYGYYVHGGKPGYLTFRVGTKKSGAMLDGREWLQLPTRQLQMQGDGK